MRIGLVVYGGLEATSGGFRYDRRLVEYLRDCGDSVEVISLPWRRYWRGVLDGLSPAIRSQLDQPVDVLIQDELCYPSLWRQNHRLRQPQAIVSLVHLVQSDAQRGRLPAVRRWIERQYLQSVDGVIATSEFTRRRASALGADANTSVVAPPAGRTEEPALTADRVRQRATERPLQIAFVGNLLARKDPLTLLSAVDRLRRDYDCAEWRLTIVGSHEADPAYAERVVEMATELNLEDHIAFTGEVSDADLASILETSHALCVPSRNEGFGMVYLEAMEYGVVPIASSHGGAGEFVTDGENGFLVEPGDVDRIAALLAELAVDRDRLAGLGVAAREAAAAHPRWDETLADVRSFLKTVSTTESSLTDDPAPPRDRIHTDGEYRS